jgi:AcrR family transcriptional regulator
MAIADRKLRAWNEREQLIVDCADAMLRSSGYLGLNLDQLAERIEYSKATIYNHFESKEDLVLAVVTRHVEMRSDFFVRALTFDGCSRERMFVIGIADMILAKLHPHWSEVLQLIQTQSIVERTTPERRAAYDKVLGKCMGIMIEILRQARASGDLPENGPSDLHVMSGLLSLSKGAHLLASGGGLSSIGGSLWPLETLFDNYHIFLDGAGWRPLRTEHDYAAVEKRIRKELFSEELARIEAQ